MISNQYLACNRFGCIWPLGKCLCALANISAFLILIVLNFSVAFSIFYSVKLKNHGHFYLGGLLCHIPVSDTDAP